MGHSAGATHVVRPIWPIPRWAAKIQFAPAGAILVSGTYDLSRRSKLLPAILFWFRHRVMAGSFVDCRN